VHVRQVTNANLHAVTRCVHNLANALILLKLYHNQKSNSIDVFYGGTTHIGTFTEPMKFGKISTGFNGHNVLDFYFDFSVSISIKEDGSYYYNDHSGFFNLMNNLLEDNIFKIKEV